MRISVINLERSQDRRAFMEGQLRPLGLDYEFFPAVDASKGQLNGVSRYDERAALRWLGHPLQPAEVGCFASHYLLWERCADSGQPMMIMEDDVELLDGFRAAVHLADQHIARHRFLRLLALAERRHHLIERLPEPYRIVRYLKGPYGTQCYALSPEGARVLLEHARVWINAVDAYIDQFWAHGLASLAITPFHVRHVGPETLETLVAGVGGAAARPWQRELRRSMTQFLYRTQRGLYNLRHPAPRL